MLQLLKRERVLMRPAAHYKQILSNSERDVFEEMKAAKDEGSLDSILASVEQLSFNEPSASKPMEPSKPTFTASVVPDKSPPSKPMPVTPSATATAAAAAAAVEKAPDINKNPAIADDKLKKLLLCLALQDEEDDEDFDFGTASGDDDLDIDDDDLLNDDDDLLDD
ncbi:hypothetical protein P5673_020036 [Acropora cervicornis]|uniref:Uncharacterized protein n=1 Tax=Acropora cervicornis TaxID=6130 RepID=A0AAD9V1V9_ACRCE|nr:hypothetical protein P5673_020036 [Acropora cervicornis]